MQIELRHIADCPHVAGARALLTECMGELGMEARFVDVEGDFPSPSILVDGVDVMGHPEFAGAGCRLDVPTKPRLLEALRGGLPPRR